MKKVSLLYGNNLPFIHFREQQLLSVFKEKFQDSLDILEFSKELSCVTEDSPSLFDKSSKVYLHVSRDAHLINFENLKKMMETTGHYFILSSPKINTKSKIFTALQSSHSTQFYKCYGIQFAEFKEIVLTYLSPHKISLTPQALALLYASFESRMDALLMELKKLLLFQIEGGEISLQDLEEMGHQKLPREILEFISSILLRHVTDFSQMLPSIIRLGHEPIPLLRNLLQHFANLQKLHLKIYEGLSFEQGFSQQKPVLFFALKELYQQAIKLWSFQDIEEAIRSLFKLEKHLKNQPSLAQELLFSSIVPFLEKAKKVSL